MTDRNFMAQDNVKSRFKLKSGCQSGRRRVRRALLEPLESRIAMSVTPLPWGLPRLEPAADSESRPVETSRPLEQPAEGALRLRASRVNPDAIREAYAELLRPQIDEDLDAPASATGANLGRPVAAVHSARDLVAAPSAVTTDAAIDSFETAPGNPAPGNPAPGSGDDEEPLPPPGEGEFTPPRSPPIYEWPRPRVPSPSPPGSLPSGPSRAPVSQPGNGAAIGPWPRSSTPGSPASTDSAFLEYAKGESFGSGASWNTRSVASLPAIVSLEGNLSAVEYARISDWGVSGGMAGVAESSATAALRLRSAFAVASDLDTFDNDLLVGARIGGARESIGGPSALRDDASSEPIALPATKNAPGELEWREVQSQDLRLADRLSDPEGGMVGVSTAQAHDLRAIDLAARLPEEHIATVGWAARTQQSFGAAGRASQPVFEIAGGGDPRREGVSARLAGRLKGGAEQPGPRAEGAAVSQVSEADVSPSLRRAAGSVVVAICVLATLLRERWKRTDEDEGSIREFEGCCRRF